MDSNGRPATLLPRLESLFLASVDPLSLYIASNSMPSFTSLKVDFACESSPAMVRQHGRALTTGLMQNAVALTHLQMAHAISRSIIENISQIQTLHTLQLTMAHGQGVDTLSLGELDRLPALETLRIDQALDPQDEEEASNLPNQVDIGAIVSQQSRLQRLKTLYVRANGTTQLNVAAALLPGNLESLTVEIFPDLQNIQLFLLPSVLGLYARRNPLLVHLKAFSLPNSKCSTTINPDTLAALRDNIGYNDVEPFLNGIAALSSLETLRIYNAPFIAVDIVPRLLNIARRLPLLRILNLNPVPATGLEVDEPVEPPLAVLEALFKENPCLTRLEISVDIPQDLPDPPAATSTHGLKRLGLQSSSIDYAKFPARDKFKLARYIERLFPQAGLITYETRPAEAEFWVFINELLSFSRESRNQALNDVENIMGI